jgi:hypothetical protein
MPRWPRGEAEIEELIARSELEPVTGAAADGGLSSAADSGRSGLSGAAASKLLPQVSFFNQD